MPPLSTLRNTLLREQLTSFIIKTFHTVDPGTSYQHNWHIDAIASYLEAVTRGEITRLIINMPPRYLKSVCVSVAWPAWLLGNDPTRRILAASYSQALSLKHSLDCRLVVQQPWYKRAFPHLAITHDQNEKAKFLTTQQGFRFATSVGGTITGEGGNFLIVDDPHNPTHIHSEAVRTHTLEWFDQTFISRLNDKKKGAIVVVMQRLHEQDLSGHLLAKQAGWEQLVLPAVAERRSIITVGKRKFIRRKGSLLHADREGKKEIARMKQELGTQAFAAQYQQQPLPAGGGLIKLEWLKRYSTAPANVPIIMSWDTAIKTAKGNDYTACTIWAEQPHGYYLLDVIRKRMEYPELKRYAIDLAEKWQPKAILIEDKASGQSLLQDMRRETSLPIIPILPHKDKLTRFAHITPLFEAGRVYLPEHAAWLPDYEIELLHFPHGPHDDQADSTSQFLGWVGFRRNVEVGVRRV